MWKRYILKFLEFATFWNMRFTEILIRSDVLLTVYEKYS